MAKIKEFHLFAGIGGGIYGGELLGHKCCGGVEILPYARTVLEQRQKDGWMDKFPIYEDICDLHGDAFKGKFDILCGGFPCQAFSSAAHGKNIAAKNLWGEMFRFVKESNAPIVFGENVVLRAIEKARADLEGVGYHVERIRLSNADIGADHQRYRFWLLAVKDEGVFRKLTKQISKLNKLNGKCWERSLDAPCERVEDLTPDRMNRLLGVGNAQSPLVAASAFRILVNRHLNPREDRTELVTQEEIEAVFEKSETWIQKTYGRDFGFVHTPTTVANYCCKSMQKHQGCRNYMKVFCEGKNGGSDNRKPLPIHAEYLMGFPIGASSPMPLTKKNIETWKGIMPC